jgi:hypothetical protein
MALIRSILRYTITVERGLRRLANHLAAPRVTSSGPGVVSLRLTRPFDGVEMQRKRRPPFSLSLTREASA